MTQVAHTQWMQTVDDYASKHRNRADVALRRVLRTEANQTSARITDDWLDTLDIDLVETSAHMGARPEHFVWQGKVFSRSGAKGYPDFVLSTGYGTVTGLCGANCRHSYGPYFEEAGQTEWGVNVDDKENERIYDLNQKQRALERNVRDKKRKLYSAGPEDARKAKNSVLSAQKKVLDYVKENPELTREYWREWNYAQRATAKKLYKMTGHGRKPMYPSSQEEIISIVSDELKGVNFQSHFVYNQRYRYPGTTRLIDYGYMRKQHGDTFISKQYNNTRETLMDTLLHEELELRIGIRGSKRYTTLFNSGDKKASIY